MLKKRRAICLWIPMLLLLANLLSACQASISTDQVVACNQKSAPVIKVLTSTQPSLQTVYASSGPNLYAFNAGNGSLRWCDEINSTDGHDEFNSISSNRNKLYTATYGQQMMVFSAHSGTLLWSNNRAVSDSLHSPPMPESNIVYGGNSEMYALGADDGSTLWQYPLPSHTRVETYPVVMDGAIYFEVSGQPDQMIALNATTGKERWILPLKYKGIGRPVASDGVVVFAESNPSQSIAWLDAVNDQNGKLIWQTPLLPDFVSPVEVNDVLYIAGSSPINGKSFKDSLYAFNIRTGAIIWSLPLNSIGVIPSLVFNNILYGVNDSGEIIALNPLDGSLLWHAQLQMPMANGIPTRLSVLNGEVFVGIESINAGTHASFILHAFNLNTREENWYTDITGSETSSGSLISVAV